MNHDLPALAQRIGHEFSDPALLDRAVTHRSHGATNNERLEFLGDAILSVVISRMLYERYADASEGELTHMRAELVNGQSLASVARSLDLGACLRLGKGELQTGGRDRDSLLANGLEAVIGAIGLDGGLEAGARCISRWFTERLDRLGSVADLKDAKTRLQEYAQARGLELPRYRIEQVDGEDHARHYLVSCALAPDATRFRGCGSSRRKAEQDAAAKVLAHLETGDE